MTVVVGFVGIDGAVMASDSEATEGGHTRYDVDKIWTCGGLLLGYTGDWAVLQPVAAQLSTKIPSTFGEAVEIDRWQGRSALENTVGPVLRHCYANHVGPVNRRGIPQALDGALLVIGRDSDGYWLLELDGQNKPTFLTDNGFHAVGSGSAAAYVARALMSEYEAGDRFVGDLKLIAHRTVQNCIDTIGGPLGVGGHVLLWSSENNSPFVMATEKEIQIIEAGVDQWRAIERIRCGRFVSEGRRSLRASRFPSFRPRPRPSLPRGPRARSRGRRLIVGEPRPDP